MTPDPNPPGGEPIDPNKGTAVKTPDVQSAKISQIMVRASGARITVIDTVAHQMFRSRTTIAEERFIMPCKSSEQPYQRLSFFVGEEWESLRLDWLMTSEGDWNCGMIKIANEEGRFLQTIPTNEEIAEEAKKVLVVGIVSSEVVSHPSAKGCEMVLHFAEVRPSGDGVTIPSIRLMPRNLRGYRIRSEHGRIKISISAFPR